jgi:hypothetical protein
MKFNLLVSFIVLFSFSCKNDKELINSINGTWQSIGNGWVLEVKDSTSYSLFDLTSISCLPSREASLDELIQSLSLQSDTLSLYKGIMTYKFIKIDALPEICDANISLEKKKDIFYNYDVFAETVKEHYAFMDLNNINWSTLGKQQKQKLLKNPTEVQLYKVLEETLEILNDNHAYLEATDELYQLLEQESFESEIPVNENVLIEYGDFQIANLVLDHHVTEDLTEDSWLIKWGMMENNVGYIQVKAMWLFADLNIPQSLIDELGHVDAYVKTFHTLDEGAYIKKEVEGVKKIMDRVMTDLEDTSAIIVDIRFNGGGQDAVNFEILKRFNPKTQPIVTTKLKHKNGYSPTLSIQLNASKDAYVNPVYVLTSPQTGSAAEAFAIGTISMSHIKRIGAATQGALSTALEKTLPNGWAFSISNEIYMDTNGISYENTGVPVDYNLDYSTDRQTFFRAVVNDLERDKRSILNTIKLLQQD